MLLVGVGLRLANLAWGSLKLDDFHSLHHASAADLATFFRVLEQDNHPPLSFALLAGARALFGDSVWSLRLPALLAGLGTLLLVWRLGARLPGLGARFAATALVAASTLHVELSTDLRMYALLGLASAGLLEALLAALEEHRRPWPIALWTVVGLHTHYHFLYTLAVLGGITLVLLSRPAHRSAARPILGAFAVAGLLSAPWYAIGFPPQLAHGLAPGGSDASAARLFEGWKNLVFLNVSVAGPTLRALGLAASVLLLALAATGLFTLRAPQAPGAGARSALLAGAAFGVPLLTWAAAHVSARAGYEWRYLAGALPAFCLLVGSEAAARGPLARTRRGALGVVLALALTLAIPNARDPGEEDYHGAIAWILARASARDAVVAADWQPRLFPHGLAWSYYAPRLGAAAERPHTLAFNDNLALLHPEGLDQEERVFCCLRSLPPHCALLQTLRERFPHEETHAFGRSVYVHVFTRS